MSDKLNKNATGHLDVKGADKYLNLEDFSKKYSFAIDNLKMRITDTEKKQNLAETLYKEALANKVDMADITNAVELFYQGNVFGQVKLNNYLDKYRK